MVGMGSGKKRLSREPFILQRSGDGKRSLLRVNGVGWWSGLLRCLSCVMREPVSRCDRNAEFGWEGMACKFGPYSCVAVGRKIGFAGQR